MEGGTEDWRDPFSIATDPSMEPLIGLYTDDGMPFLAMKLQPGKGTQDITPIKLEYAYTRLADGDDHAWIRRRFTAACAALGTDVAEDAGRLVTGWR